MKLINKDSLWITLSNVIKLIFGLSIVPIISRNVGPQELGKLDLLMAYGPFINQFISMGLTNSSAKFFKEYQLFVIIKYMQHKIFIRSVFLVSVFAAYFIFVEAQQIQLTIVVIVLYSISVFIENITFLSQNQFLNENAFQKYAMITTLHTIIRQAISLLLVVLMDDKLLALCLGLVTSNAYLLTVNLIYHKSLLVQNLKEPALSADIKSALIKYSRPLFFLGLVGLLYQASDKLLVAHFSAAGDTTQVGYLGMAQRIIGVLTVGLSGLFTVWGVRSFENYEDEILIKEKEKLIVMMLVVLVGMMLGMYLFKPIIIKYLLTTQYSNSFPIIILLVGTFVNNRIREILEKYFLRKGLTKLISTIFTVFGILSILISAILLYFYNLEVMLMFRLMVALLHAFTLFIFLRRNGQHLNPSLMIFNFTLSVFVILIMKFGWM